MDKRVIEEMIHFILMADIDFYKRDFCKGRKLKDCYKTSCKECIREYFYKKVEEENE